MDTTGHLFTGGILIGIGEVILGTIGTLGDMLIGRVIGGMVGISGEHMGLLMVVNLIRQGDFLILGGTELRTEVGGGGGMKNLGGG